LVVKVMMCIYNCQLGIKMNDMYDMRINMNRVAEINDCNSGCCPMGSVATAIAGVFANFTNKIDKITEKLEDVDKAKSQGVSCQH